MPQALNLGVIKNRSVSSLVDTLLGPEPAMCKELLRSLLLVRLCCRAHGFELVISARVAAPLRSVSRLGPSGTDWDLAVRHQPWVCSGRNRRLKPWRVPRWPLWPRFATASRTLRQGRFAFPAAACCLHIAAPSSGADDNELCARWRRQSMPLLAPAKVAALIDRAEANTLFYIDLAGVVRGKNMEAACPAHVAMPSLHCD